jgi:mRNA interferase RelE/StbE
VPDAWDKKQSPDISIKHALKPLLAKRLQTPHVPGAQLHRALADYYKITLLKQGYRLVYIIEDDQQVVLVLSVGKREESAAYRAAVNILGN